MFIQNSNIAQTTSFYPLGLMNYVSHNILCVNYSPRELLKEKTICKPYNDSFLVEAFKKKSSLHSLNILPGVTSERCPSLALNQGSYFEIAAVASRWQRLGD